jgi:hypothetical protein
MKLLIFQRELIHGPDERGDIGPELLEFSVLVGDRFFEFGDGGAQADFDLRGRPALGSVRRSRFSGLRGVG